MDVVPGYEPLAEVFQTALNQSQKGKGKERHANDKPFLQQPIAMIGRMVGVGYNVGQAMKKGQESMRLPDDRAQAELLGAMVYLASAYLLIRERMEAEKRAAVDTPPIALGSTEAYAAVLRWEDAQREPAHKVPSLCDSEDVRAAAYPYTFPAALKYMGMLSSDYVVKLREEVGEVSDATNPTDRVVELLDVIHAAETAIRSQAHDHGLDVRELVSEVIRKNSERGYYQR